MAIGTGSYDGGHFFEGELLLVHLESGQVTSALHGAPEVLEVAWEVRGWR
ncbi:hypothetical protein [Streptomyces sp. Act143]|nr:hypothetical protein [Streptomyces sp. Act143]